MKTIEVSAAIIKKGNKIFCTQRGYGEFKDMWEFPGGKLEPEETPEDAIVREIKEELATDIKIEKFITTVRYTYPNFNLIMHCFLCSLITENIELLEHESAVWLDIEKLDELDWLPADLIVLNDIRNL